MLLLSVSLWARSSRSVFFLTPFGKLIHFLLKCLNNYSDIEVNCLISIELEPSRWNPHTICSRNSSQKILCYQRGRSDPNIFFLFLEHGVGSRQGAQVSCRLLLILYFDFTSETCCVAEGESSWLRFLKYGGSLEECQPRTHASTLKIKVPQFVLILKFWIMTRNHLMAELSLNHKTCPSHFELLNSRMPFVHNDK